MAILRVKRTSVLAGVSAIKVGLFQAVAHGVTGGFMSHVQGGNFWSGAASGAVSSAIGSLTAGYGKEVQILMGGLSGGIASSIAGGDFWDGVKQGLITSGLNHAVHGLFDQPQPDPLKDHLNEAVTIEEWREHYSKYTIDQIRNEAPKRQGMPGGPLVRYVIDPTSGNVIDMRHFTVIGGMAKGVGDFVEELQYVTGQQSGRQPQDYFSNDLGRKFYNTHQVTIYSTYATYRYYNFPQGYANSVYNFLSNRQK